MDNGALDLTVTGVSMDSTRTTQCSEVDMLSERIVGTEVVCQKIVQSMTSVLVRLEQVEGLVQSAAAKQETHRRSVDDELQQFSARLEDERQDRRSGLKNIEQLAEEVARVISENLGGSKLGKVLEEEAQDVEERLTRSPAILGSRFLKGMAEASLEARIDTLEATVSDELRRICHLLRAFVEAVEFEIPGLAAVGTEVANAVDLELHGSGGETSNRKSVGSLSVLDDVEVRLRPCASATGGGGGAPLPNSAPRSPHSPVRRQISAPARVVPSPGSSMRATMPGRLNSVQELESIDLSRSVVGSGCSIDTPCASVGSPTSETTGNAGSGMAVSRSMPTFEQVPERGRSSVPGSPPLSQGCRVVLASPVQFSRGSRGQPGGGGSVSIEVPDTSPPPQASAATSPGVTTAARQNPPASPSLQSAASARGMRKGSVRVDSPPTGVDRSSRGGRRRSEGSTLITAKGAHRRLFSPPGVPCSEPPSGDAVSLSALACARSQAVVPLGHNSPRVGGAAPAGIIIAHPMSVPPSRGGSLVAQAPQSQRSSKVMRSPALVSR